MITVPYTPPRLPEAEMLRCAREFFARMSQRRSVRQFAADPVPRELIELAIATAATAPSVTCPAASRVVNATG